MLLIRVTQNGHVMSMDVKNRHSSTVTDLLSLSSKSVLFNSVEIFIPPIFSVIHFISLARERCMSVFNI